MHMTLFPHIMAVNPEGIIFTPVQRTYCIAIHKQNEE